MTAVTDYIIQKLKGGPGSGYFGHAGRIGKRGGSAPVTGSVDMSAVQHLVSQKLQNTIKMKAHRAAVDNTLLLIDSVHSIPANFRNIPITKTRKAMEGGLKRRIRDYCPIEIMLNKHGCEDTGSLVHEVGHYLDANSTYNESVNNNDNIITKEARGKILTAVARSKSFLDFKKLFYQRIRINNTTDNSTVTARVDGKYWGNSMEIIARAYMQYIGVKTKDANIAKYIKRHVGKPRVIDGAIYLPFQWTARDFDPIEKAFDEVFAEIGWRSSSEQN
jgi:hypothetical protein